MMQKEKTMKIRKRKKGNKEHENRIKSEKYEQE